MCWVKEGCSSLKPKACSSLPLEAVDHVDYFNAAKLNLHLNKGCFSSSNLQAQVDNDRASCNPSCFRITKFGEYGYMSTHNDNFSNGGHMGQRPVSQKSRNFSGQYRVPQFPLYLRNAEVLSLQTSQSS